MSGKRKRELPPVPLFHEMSPFEKRRLAWVESQRKRQAGLDELVNKLEEELREVQTLLREAPVQGAVSRCGRCGQTLEQILGSLEQLDKEIAEDEPEEEFQDAEMESEHELEEDSVLDLTSERCPEEVAVLDLTADSCREEVADEHSRPRGSRIA